MLVVDYPGAYVSCRGHPGTWTAMTVSRMAVLTFVVLPFIELVTWIWGPSEDRATLSKDSRHNEATEWGMTDTSHSCQDA